MQIMKRANTFITMGANGLVSNREENDFYATEPKATELLLEKETFNKNILEPCAGMGHIRDVLVSHGYNVTTVVLMILNRKMYLILKNLMGILLPIHHIRLHFLF